MNNSYIDMVSAFSELDIESKREEILKEVSELLSLFYYMNKKCDSLNEALPVLQEYDSEDEYLDELFTILISLKEESAKVVERSIIDY